MVADGDAGEPGGATVNDIDIGGRWSPTAMLVNPIVSRKAIAVSFHGPAGRWSPTAMLVNPAVQL